MPQDLIDEYNIRIAADPTTRRRDNVPKTSQLIVVPSAPQDNKTTAITAVSILPASGVILQTLSITSQELIPLPKTITVPAKRGRGRPRKIQ